MRTLFTLALGLLTAALFAQTDIHKKYSVKKGDELVLKFDYPQLVKITTWDQNEVQINGKVYINNGENDSAFELIEQSSNHQKTIEGRITNYKALPHRVTAYNGKEKVEFNSIEEFKSHQKQTKQTYNTTTMGVQIDIVLEIKVPKHMKTQIESVYGTVEVNSFDGPLVAKSTYGGVDTTIQSKKIGEITVETYYGVLYSNLDFSLKAIKDDNFHKIATATIGQGPKQEYSSQYGNVYLRK
ncbi:hypothetical protein [Empedobacter tilapiae]|uniref:hypothetical protein n=1 Tax=Empedobacter tilapiae TaxID=2491114 RepID=UPI0028D74CAB|nr:hypothetical protein [Empedobacter tilapiae]